jgi:hypothetical protein
MTESTSGRTRGLHGIPMPGVQNLTNFSRVKHGVIRNFITPFFFEGIDPHVHACQEALSLHVPLVLFLCITCLHGILHTSLKLTLAWCTRRWAGS